MCMDLNAKVHVCSHIGIWDNILDFCLVGCFVMGEL